MDSGSITRDSRFEAVDLISGTTVAGALYALIIVVYCLSARLSFSQLRNSDGKISRPRVLTLVVATSMMICATIDVVLSNIQRQIAYVDYGTLPGGPLGLAISVHTATLEKIRHVVRPVEKFLILGVMVWRVLVIWRGTPVIKPVTLALYVANAGIWITDLVMAWQTAGKRANPSASLQIKMGTFIASLAFATAMMVFMALMLVIRLLSARWQHIKVMGKSDSADQYLSIVAILTESYVLEAVWNICLCVFCALKFVPVDNFFDATVIPVDVLTNLLVIYRVVSGRAWDRQTHSRVSTLRWNHHNKSDASVGSIDP